MALEFPNQIHLPRVPEFALEKMRLSDNSDQWWGQEDLLMHKMFIEVQYNSKQLDWSSSQRTRDQAIQMP